ncbi:GMC family oxidoreductase [Lentzea sp. NPDC058450]|uniref:GMC family oxidoreductase n=1 Tax=Lentzea sp. NPDC058450 TaxID=3346505 RepID=UPI0036657ECA
MSYDYVVVGGGTAGCVLASRLSDDPSVRVLLLEAGPVGGARAIQVPALMPSLLGSGYDWSYRTVSQPHAAGRRVDWPQGHVLGGTSSINAMIYVRGHSSDFDTWRDAYGATGWGHADLVPYFRRVEERLRVEAPRRRSPLPRAWVDSAGLDVVPTLSGEAEAAGFYSLTTRRGRRWSAADAYLSPRPNLHVLTGVLVTKVLVSRGRAVGVQYQLGGDDQEVRAGREVVLSAGAIRSPHLLLLSGIGPADHLRLHGIPVEVDAPSVGQGLQDHPRVTALWQAKSGPRLGGYWRWKLFGRGPLASNGGEAGAFVRTKPGLAAPDLQYHVCPPGVGAREAAVLVTTVAVRSRGSIRLASGNAHDGPSIDPGYLSDEADLDVLVAGVRQAREIAARAPFAGLVSGELAPGVPDDRVPDWVRENLVTMHHPTSSCAMGGAESSAVAPDLRVRGVEGLRVVDASVMPAVTSGNTNAPTYAIAERAADLILGNTPLAPVEE